MINKPIRFSVAQYWSVALVFGLLVGCGGKSLTDLDEYMNEVRRRPAPPIEPIPTFPQYESFVYGAAVLRSPFEQPQALEELIIEAGRVANASAVKPDELRVKEYLEQFNIASITMVGTVEKDGQLWGLVDDGTGNVHRIQPGNYLGRNHGRIIHVDRARIEVVEIVPNGPDGWMERPKSMPLQEIAE